MDTNSPSNESIRALMDDFSDCFKEFVMEDILRLSSRELDKEEIERWKSFFKRSGSLEIFHKTLFEILVPHILQQSRAEPSAVQKSRAEPSAVQKSHDEPSAAQKSPDEPSAEPKESNFVDEIKKFARKKRKLPFDGNFIFPSTSQASSQHDQLDMPQDFESQASQPVNNKKKLLVFDLNGLLVDISNKGKQYGGNNVQKRPHLDDFLKFCFENFDIGIWTSRKRHNMVKILDSVLMEARSKLIFCWDQDDCISVETCVPGTTKPIFLKAIKRLWHSKPEYNETNTLLIDDSPYKALINPAHTSIFPETYHPKNKEDNALGHGGELRCYLEGLLQAKNVQDHVKENSFGQNIITEQHPDWSIFSKVKFIGLQKLNWLIRIREIY